MTGAAERKRKPVAPQRARAARLTREERSARIRLSALRVLAENGIGHTNHSMVAAEAGVAVQTIFFYYPTHAELTAAVLESVGTRIVDESVRAVFKAEPDCLRALERMLLVFAALIDKDRDLARVWLDWSTAVRDATWALYLRVHADACALVADRLAAEQARGALAAGLDPAEAAQVVIGLAHMVAQMKLAGNADDQIGRIIRSLLHSYIR